MRWGKPFNIPSKVSDLLRTAYRRYPSLTLLESNQKLWRMILPLQRARREMRIGKGLGQVE